MTEAEIEKTRLLEMKNVEVGDASPTLKIILRNKAVQGKLFDMVDDLRILEQNMGGITLTIGTTSQRPSNPTNNKNIHMNTTTGIPEYYSSNAWRQQVATFLA